ncbi:MAG: phage integrase N-terminal SAM-like domain-containing protein [Deltaproteobacteria bacterium]|nr:phage integrase N-terminal SAM-like domain-containing protein [Deltaproteobacteria bacterium]
MAPLRQQMIREMDLKNLSSNTRRTYLRAVTGLVWHYRQSREAITKEMIENYLLHLKTKRVMRQPVAAYFLPACDFSTNIF